MNRILFYSLFFTCSLFSKAQEACSYTPELHGEVDISGLEPISADDRTGIIYVGIKFHVVSFLSNITPAPLTSILEQVNASFLPHNIQFVNCGDYLFYDDYDIWWDNNAAGTISRDNHAVAGVVNVFIVNHISYSGAGAYALPTRDQVVVPYYSLNWKTLSHELGHVLSLAHTHSTTSGAELVNGSNCLTAGDQICDTPADPNLGVSGMLTNCVYTGTVTDANGDAYNPDPLNLMSYAGNCRSHFSTEQGLRMYNVLSTVKWYLTQYPEDNSMIVHDQYTFCSNDSSSYALTGTPAGGTFSGTGVTGTDFSPLSLAGGTYALTYNPGVTTDSMDIVNPYWASPTNFAFDTLTDAWQAVHIENDGRMLSYRHLIKVAQTTNVTLRIYQGTGTSGTLLHTQTILLAAGTSFDWINFNITNLILISTGQYYTFRISADQPMILMKAYEYIDGAYIDASCNWAAYFSHHFGLTIRTLNPCGNVAHAYLKVNAAQQGIINDLNASYCEAVDSILLNGTPSSGTFFVDGTPSVYLNPSDLGVGSHTVSFESTDVSGCPGTVSQTISVDAFPVYFPASFGPYCLTDNTEAHNGFPAGGNFYVDNISTDSIYPGSLSPGLHSATYIYQELTDTVFQLDQYKLHVSGSQVWPLQSPLPDSVYWQSFVPAVTGYLDRFQLMAYNWQNQTFEMSLYEGEGTAGNLLFIDTTLFTTSAANVFVDFLVPDGDLQVTAGSAYTVAYRWISGPPSPPIYQVVGINNGYVPGHSGFDTTAQNEFDFYFREYIRNYANCIDSATTQFLVEDCTAGIAGDDSETIHLFPNPANDVLYVSPAEPGAVYLIFNSLGQLVQEGALEVQLDIHQLESGLYYIRISDGSASVLKKLTIN